MWFVLMGRFCVLSQRGSFHCIPIVLVAMPCHVFHASTWMRHITVVPHDPKRSGWQDSVEQFIADALAVGGGSGDTAVLTALARDSYSALK